MVSTIGQLPHNYSKLTTTIIFPCTHFRSLITLYINAEDQNDTLQLFSSHLFMPSNSSFKRQNSQ